MGQQPGDPSDATSTAYAATSITLRGNNSRARSRGHAYLRTVQQPDGAFTAPPDTCSPRPLLLNIEILPTIYALGATTQAQLISVASSSPR